jgi:hypothetical protein
MKNNNLVEEAIIQMKNVEKAIAENAKGILQSTMKEEISQLVKESLSEQEDEMEIDSLEDDKLSDMSDDESNDEMEFDDTEDEMNFGDEDEMEFDDEEEEVVDLTDIEDEDEILSIFAKMSPEDGIVVKKDKNQIHIKDDNSDSEYLVNLGESEEDMYEYSDSEFNEEDDDMETQNVINRIFGEMDSELGEEMDEPIYEIEMDEEMEEEMEDDIEEMEETIYEIEMEEEEMDEEEMDDIEESYNPKHAKKGEHKEGKMSIKPKGVGLGKGPKTSKMTSNTEGGFDEDMPEGKKSIGTGKAKFSYKEGENLEGKNKVVKKSETKEAARTLGNGKRWGREGLDKPRTAPRHLKVESLEEVSLLRQKNEEYRKALNVFREKLNEVAVFNSNLAYATRLFTEHSTTKKEKINILRRFDNVENIRESKSLYKSIKDELTKTDSKPINETLENKVNKTVTTGSSTTLIESKTYENPQFLRMKDLMSKIG